jgi:hypothetical protein
VTARARKLLAAFTGFLRGFTGLEPLARDPAGAKRDLERRAAQRRSCC